MLARKHKVQNQSHTPKTDDDELVLGKRSFKLEAIRSKAGTKKASVGWAQSTSSHVVSSACQDKPVSNTLSGQSPASDIN